ncbi:PSK operon transcription factor [Bosea sp. F3-2]|uniref:type II toxin-antitoxin system VapB family antitoxin n=1 Tax=Bosea sp. F3-2 TaxID=2599640 RepID=UPI0011F048F5|nr:type II toxin-antitoxin system VapB family antitoxin [Bosea sp. F3-2]QEL23293.1 PSK operon transcription factor [Bosea sp. F3-2]
MSVLIIDSETDRLVRELASRTGVTPAEAVKIAAEERLARLPAHARKGRFDPEKLEKILAQIRSYPLTNEHLTDDEIIGYDENGVPS